MATCPACDYADLAEEAWVGGDGSQEICPRCKIQFGYDDACGGDAAERVGFQRGWGASWRRNHL